MIPQKEDRRLTDYARTLRWALAALPEADRESIVAEMRSHVLDRVDSGASLDEALAALGNPQSYAKEFCDAYMVASALSTRRTPHLIGALAQSVLQSVAALAAGVAMLVIWAAATLIAYCAILKISDPEHVGLWLGENFFFIGIIDDPSTGEELLGPWLMPLAFVVIVLAWFVTRGLAVSALRRRAPRA
ncbi:MAG: DUF1700 domain-containing protein [Hyphomonadaceae bacterium]